MRKVTDQPITLGLKDGVFKSINEIQHMTDEVVQFHGECAVTLLRTDDPKHYALAFHHLAALVDLQLNSLGFSLADFNPNELDKLSPRLQELTLKAQEWRHLPTLESVEGFTKDLLIEYGRLLQKTYNEEVLPLLKAKINELEGV